MCGHGRNLFYRTGLLQWRVLFHRDYDHNDHNEHYAHIFDYSYKYEHELYPRPVHVQLTARNPGRTHERPAGKHQTLGTACQRALFLPDAPGRELVFRVTALLENPRPRLTMTGKP